MPFVPSRRWLPPAALALALAPAGAAAAAAPAFVELGPEAGLDFVHFNGMTGRFYMPEINSGGGALVDYDGDGDLDVYLTQGQLLDPTEEPLVAPRHPPPLTDRLYRNDLVVHPDGRRELRFTDVTASAGLVPAAYGFGVAAGDYDDDGRTDLYVTRLGSNTLLHNEGDGTFRDATAEAGVDDPRWSVPALFADLDADGRLDLVVGNYVDFTLATHKVCRTATGALDYCGPSAYGGVSDRLFRNRGDGTFEDVTAAAGLQRETPKTLGLAAGDVDGDGTVDLYVASDQTPNLLWLQRAPWRFSEEALLAGCAVNAAGKAEASMGVDLVDVDADGDLDLFMSHIVRETNTLFVNDGAGGFEDTTAASGLGVASWAHTGWGLGWLDYDNDGHLDVLVANGAVLRIEELTNAGDPFPFHETNQLFRGVGGGRFVEATAHGGPPFLRSEVSRAVLVGDLDLDGDPDAVVVNNNGPARVLVDQVGQDRHWLGLRLLASTGRDALGTRVELVRDGRVQWERVRTDGSFAAARDPRVLLGLGGDPATGRLRLHWHGGPTEEWRNLPPDRRHERRRAGG